MTPIMKPFLLLQTVKPASFHSGRTLGFIRFVFLLVAMMSVAFSHAGAETHDELVARYMKVNSKTQSQLDQVVSTDSSAVASVPESIKQKFMEFVEQSKREAIRLYSLNLDDDSLRDLIAWHESPLGKKTGMRIIDKEAMAAFLVEFSKSPNAKQRVELINKLDSITRYSDTASEIACDFIVDSFSALPKVSSSEAGRNAKKTSFSENLEKRKGVLVPLMKRGMWMTLLYNYRDLTDDELRASIAFNETDAGRKGVKCTNLMLRHMAGCWKDFCIKNPEVVTYLFVQGQINALPQEKGPGQNGEVPAQELMLASARFEEMSRDVQEKKVIIQAKLPRGTIEYSECMVPPSFSNDSKPVYPERARLAGIQGSVFVRVLIDEQGRAVKAEIVKRVPADTNVFDRAAVIYIMSARFSPGQINGKKVSVWMTIPVRFALDDKSGYPVPGATQKETGR